MSDDEQGRELREQLDRELAGLTARPELLREVLAGARPEVQRTGPDRRGRGKPPAWFLAAAAVLVVALAVPVLRGTVFDGSRTRDHLASPSLPPDLRTTPAPTAAPPPVPTRRPKVSPSPHRSVTAAPRATATSPSCSSTGATPAASFDLDGDGVPDTVSLRSGGVTVQLTASSTTTTPLPVSGPYVEVLPVRADSSRGAELLVLTRGPIGKDGTIGMQGRVYQVHTCSLSPVLNAQGGTYTFEVGSNADDSTRAGVSCADGALFGVTSVRAPDGWDVTRTPVHIAAGRAVNGLAALETVPADDPAAETLRQASCGSAVPVALG